MFDAKYKVEFITNDVIEKIKCFWEWFEFNKTDIEKSIKNNDQTILNRIHPELKKVFSGYKKDIPFALGYKDNKFLLYVYFKHNSYLLTIGDTLMNDMPKYLKDDWKIYVLK